MNPRQLEARLGVTLLTRTSRTVALTDAGRRLVENAGPAVDVRETTAVPGRLAPNEPQPEWEAGARIGASR